MALFVCLLAVVPVGLMWDQVHPQRIPLTDDPGRHGLAFEDIAFVSARDGIVLQGWYLRASSGSGRAVVIAPGSDQNRLAGGATLGLAPALLAAGFDVLAFDFRAEGTSGGDTLTYGAREQFDVLGAVAAARARGDAHVAVLGFSLGAASAILAAGRSTDIEAIVADSSFADLRVTIERHLAVAAHLPPPLVQYGVFLYAWLTGTDPGGVSPVAVAARVGPRPMLFIDGADDDVVQPADSRALVAAAGSTAVLWDVPGAGHVKSFAADPAAYTAHVLDFLAAAMPR